MSSPDLVPIDRRALLGGLVLSVLPAPLVAQAQQGAKLSRIGYLSSHSPETFRSEAFRQGLHEFGWVEGRNLIIDYRSADGKFDRIPLGGHPKPAIDGHLKTGHRK